MLTTPFRILFFLASPLLVVLGILKLDFEQEDLVLVGIEELENYEVDADSIEIDPTV